MAIASSTYVRTPALEAIRDNLIFERAKRRFSQQLLAERSGVGRATISRLECGTADDVGIRTIQSLADALEISIDRLFRWRDPSAPVDDDEILRRSRDPESEFVDAHDLLEAIEEAETYVERYSKAGRPAISRNIS